MSDTTFAAPPFVGVEFCTEDAKFVSCGCRLLRLKEPWGPSTGGDVLKFPSLCQLGGYTLAVPPCGRGERTSGWRAAAPHSQLSSTSQPGGVTSVELDTKSLEWKVNTGSEDGLTSILFTDSFLTLLEFFFKFLGGSVKAGVVRGNFPVSAGFWMKGSLGLRNIWLDFLTSGVVNFSDT